MFRSQPQKAEIAGRGHVLRHKGQGQSDGRGYAETDAELRPSAVPELRRLQHPGMRRLTPRSGPTDESTRSEGDPDTARFPAEELRAAVVVRLLNERQPPP